MSLQLPRRVKFAEVQEAYKNTRFYGEITQNTYHRPGLLTNRSNWKRPYNCSLGVTLRLLKDGYLRGNWWISWYPAAA